VLERDGYPPGVPCFVDTSQPDPVAAQRFYGELFGWEFDDRMPVDAPGHYFVARLDGRGVAAIASQPAEVPTSAPLWSTYIAVASADDAAVAVTNAGGRVLAEPFDVRGAGRMAVVADPSGASLRLWQAIGHPGAQVVNAPGTWNWSDLQTSDLEDAKAFYGAVFGWETDSIGEGDGALALVRLPGYGDVLEQRDPDLRRRQAAAGAPPGFEDAVAWMAPAGDGVAPHWSVTFAVDDTDAIAAKAAELGGTVVVAPYDIAPVRIAVLSDPQGAVFAVNTYEPPSGR
jgi:predicted enzyme related to lactoylglutathione lyase